MWWFKLRADPALKQNAIRPILFHACILFIQRQAAAAQHAQEPDFRIRALRRQQAG